MRTRFGLLVSRHTHTRKGDVVEKVTPTGTVKELKKTGTSWWSSGEESTLPVQGDWV